MTSVCGYASLSDFNSGVRKCYIRYSLDEGTKFGWSNYYYDTVKDILYNGRMCKTGLAIPIYNATNLT
jgi:hypothetical protein